MPTSPATTRAVVSWSPVTIQTSRPRSCRPATAAAEVGLTVSATSRRPAYAPSTATRTPPPSASTPWAARWALLPARTVRPPTSAVTPWPGVDSKLATAGSTRPRTLAARTIASPTGCSLPTSAAATRASSSSASHPSAVMISRTSGRPRVIVPVLSSTTVVSRRAVSSARPSPIKMPISAARPVPTITAVGVASPRAHGQAMISTATVVLIASVRRCPSGPKASQPRKVASATTSTAGTNHAVTWSARRCIGGAEAWASSTRRTIWASVLSAPTAVVRTTMVPVVLTVAPMTVAPTVLSTGALSPVSIDSSTADRPSTTAPSTGSFSPGRTRTRSPTTTAVRGTSTSARCPSAEARSTRAVAGARSTNARRDAEVRFFAFSSSQRPIRIRATTMSALSKYRCSGRPHRSARPGQSTTKALNP